MLTQYELLYIIPATFTDEDVGRIESTVKALIEKQGATIDTTTRLGKFRFAYPIKNVRHGHYILAKFSAEGSVLKAVDDALRISTDVLRHLILRADEAGGDKFDLVQFTEVNLDNKDDRPRRRVERPDEKKSSAEIKSGVAVLEGGASDKPAAPVAELSAEELEKKIDTALQEKA